MQARCRVSHTVCVNGANVKPVVLAKLQGNKYCVLIVIGVVSQLFRILPIRSFLVVYTLR